MKKYTKFTEPKYTINAHNTAVSIKQILSLMAKIIARSA